MLLHFCLVLASIGCCIMIFYHCEPRIGQSSLEFASFESNNTLLDSNLDIEAALFSACVLAEFGDGWTKELLRSAKINKNPIKKCDEKFKPKTVLSRSGSLRIREDQTDVEYQARSIKHLTERQVTYGEWTTLSHQPSSPFDAEFIHTRCFSTNKTLVEDFVHIQVIKKVVGVEDSLSKDLSSLNTLPRHSSGLESGEDEQMVSRITDAGAEEESSSVASVEEVEEVADVEREQKYVVSVEQERPSVYIFVVDSVSNSQALRSLPKTLSLLKKEHDAVNMRHVNKVGENSHPNGLALFFGKLVTRLDRSLFGLEDVEPDWDKTEHCHGFLDDKGFVLEDFTKAGYASLMAEDWASGVFNYPTCWGFSSPPVTHYMRPFQIHYEKRQMVSRRFQGPDQCLESHSFLYQYLSAFIHQYPTTPKIALTWASNVAHNDEDRLFHFDAQLFDLFRSHREEFDRSYVFLMGDHGMRFGAVRNTWIGNREVNNPMLFLSVPRHLRARLNPMLKDNAEKLLTSFDIHASLVDILRDPEMKTQEGPKERWGSSLFRPLPGGERSCRTLPIPVRYCLCEWNRTEVVDFKERKQMGEAATGLLNDRLRSENMTDVCEEFSLKQVKTINRIDGTRGIHEIHFKTNQCNAQFKALIRVEKENGTLIAKLASDEFTRTNSYGNSAECMNSRAELRPICCCK